ncbi:plasmid partition protein [Kitasatospora sp. NPDC048296]|uniref:plasmid partition protein n=1 Tax=Kitasatospora sp. NPDC048296 TaxID=3364048 RepID=UPI003720E936
MTILAAISPRSTGKTTAIWWLLHALAARGYPAKGFDADESEQLYRWWKARPEDEDGNPLDGLSFEVEKLASKRFHEEAPGKLPEGSIGAVDCGHLENHAGIGWSVLRVADLVIVVCASTPGDVERIEELPMGHFIDQVIPKRADKKRPNTWALIVRVQPGTTVAPTGVRDDLKALGFNVFTTMIPATQQYAGTAEGVPIHAPGSAFDELVTEMETRGLISK